MFDAIQRAYYEEARDPSKLDVLADLGQGLGFEREAFMALTQSTETRDALDEEFKLRNALGARSFPSVGMQRDGQFQLLTSGWLSEHELHASVAAAGLLGSE